MPNLLSNESALYPPPPPLKANLKVQLDDWLRDCVIEPADSPWASPLVPVKKKNGDSFPTPNISEVLETLGESRVFSMLDAQNAYHCISIEEKSRPLTAFTTGFIRLPFGLKNAGKLYYRLVSKLIEMLGVEGLLAYLDDLLLHTQDVSSQATLLKLVLQAHRELNLTLRKRACSGLKLSIWVMRFPQKELN